VTMADRAAAQPLRVAFIGLGVMGLPMAANLAKGGHLVSGYDTSAAAREAASRYGVASATEIADATVDADVVITMLPNGTVVRDVVKGESGIAVSMRADALYIDMSTIAPAETDDIAAIFSARGIAMIDAPVARSSKEAWEGQLLVMAGGEAAEVARAKPLLDLMADSVMHCGPVGAGIRMKLVNNYMSLTINVVTAEALAMAQRSGVSRDIAFRVMSQTVAGKGHLTTTYPAKAFKGDLEPGFMIDLARKDLDLILQMASAAGVPGETAAAALRIYDHASRNGRGRQDHTAIYDMCVKGGPWA
jgi:4-hydroxybutyrate dehydrogenase / sulfolactaldehyde 3-reductase